jgi:hypothetical protein
MISVLASIRKRIGMPLWVPDKTCICRACAAYRLEIKRRKTTREKVKK